MKSVVTAPAVPSPTLLTAAACALAAASPVTAFSWLSWSAVPWAGKLGCEGVDVADVELLVLVAALAVPKKLAPRAPPVKVAAARPPPMASLRMAFMEVVLCVLMPERFGHKAGSTLHLGYRSDLPWTIRRLAARSTRR